MNAIRTVSNGRIKLNNRWWEPDKKHIPYDGRLDGHRFFFMEYPNVDTGLVALWGTEEEALGLPSPEYELVDGGYPWYFWFLAP